MTSRVRFREGHLALRNNVAVWWGLVRTMVDDVKHWKDLEHLPDGTTQVDNVRLVDRYNTRKPIVGTLYLTATHLIFVDPAGKKETWVLHMHISCADKLPLTTSGCPLQIRCKNFLNITFVFPRERDCHDILTSLQTLYQPELGELYAFHYISPDIANRKQGWHQFDLQSEYLRMGLSSDNWTLTHINREYEICDTYSQYLYVPTGVPTPVLMGSARFRSRSRLPALSYLHRANQAALCRCSQPLAGFSARCVEDEQMLQAIRRANPTSKFMFVIDTRPKINAMVNRAAGKGYENESFYSNIKFQFFGIENIHVMRSSLQKLLEVCELKNPSMSSFLSGIENSGWLKHIKSIMDTSVFISKAIQKGISVLVHCSDGWDRTAQTCSVASLLLDPYYRRIEGFQTLIEKEWLSFGHKFIDRCGFLGTVDTREVSPVFTQFLDCVWQLMQQFPRSFEFNEQFLHMLHDHVFSCQFGTFIGNCEKDRIDLRLHERTYSLWAHLSKYSSDFLNPFYQRDLELTQPILQPATNPQSFRFWRGLYCRFDSGIHPRENVYDVVRALKDHTTSLQDHCQLLEKRIASLCKLLGHGEDQLQVAMQNLSSSESMDFRALLLNESRKAPEDDGVNQPSQAGNRPPHRCESDAESGFEDGGSSLMSKSVNDVTMEPLDLDSLQIYQLLLELQSVAVEWKSFRKVQSCRCAMPFEHFTKKYHCWSCGNIYCTRCIDRMMSLPGHLSQQAVHVCKACYKDMKQSPSASVNDLQQLQRQTKTHSNTARTTSVNSV